MLFLGHGIYQYENKYFRYEGQWRNGTKHGELLVHIQRKTCKVTVTCTDEE